MSLFLFLFFFSSLAQATPQKTLNLYTERKEFLIRPLLKEYEKLSGVKVKYHTGKAPALIKRIKEEGKNTSADLFMTVDGGSLLKAQKEKLLYPLSSSILKKVPKSYRAKDGSWYALSLRARPIFYNPKYVSVKDLKDYRGLADKKWKGRLCLRTSKKVYNQALLSSLIYKYGEKEVRKIIKGWVKNLATKVYSSDTQLLKAISKGVCHVGIANSYYYVRLSKKDDKLASKLKVFFPKNTHLNISGAGVTKFSKKKEEAKKFLQWLTTKKAQKMFAEANHEYPIVKGVKPSSCVKKMGKVKLSTVPLEKTLTQQIQGLKLAIELNYK